MKKVKIKDFEQYEIYEDGRIFSFYSGKFLKPRFWKSKGGRLRVSATLSLGKRNYKTFALSRLLASHFIPNPKKLPEVDHIDGDCLNNRLGNLRWVTHEQNLQNRKKTKSKNKYGKYSKFKGVYWCQNGSAGKWKSQIKVNKKRIRLGSFENELDAARAYNEAAKKYHGEFAYLNTV